MHLSEDRQKLENSSSSRGSSHPLQSSSWLEPLSRIFRTNRYDQDHDRGLSHTLSLIDAGLVVTLTPQDHRNFIDLFYAVVTDDGKAAAKLMVARSVSKSTSHPHSTTSVRPPVVDYNGFESKMQDIITRAHRSGLRLRELKLDELLRDVLLACYVHKVKLDPAFSTLILSLGVLDGLGRQLDPDLDLLRAAMAFIFEAKTSAEYSSIL